MARALLLYPEFPLSFWSGKYALEFVGNKAALPPLGLATIAALFPDLADFLLISIRKVLQFRSGFGLMTLTMERIWMLKLATRGMNKIGI